MFNNLKYEMKKRKWHVQDLEDLLDVAYSTAYGKLNGKTEFTLREAEMIQAAFPDCEWKYLFAREAKAS